MFGRPSCKALETILKLKTFQRFNSSEKQKRSVEIFGVPEIDVSKYNCENADVNLINSLQEQIKKEQDSVKKAQLVKTLLQESNKIQNECNKEILEYGEQPRVVKTVKNKEYNFKLREVTDIGKSLRGLICQDMSPLTGQRSYYFTGELAELEHALVRYTLKKLKDRKFELISVPDILPSHVIERCGMSTAGNRSQVIFIKLSTIIRP